MSLLLIGAAGYVGSALLPHLLERGFQVDTVDLGWFGSTRSENLRVDYATLDREFLGRYETIVLLAAHSSVAMCQREPERALANNVANFAALLAKLDRQRLIYASSVSVYGTKADAMEFTEEAPMPEPVNHYDFQKQAIDRCARLSGAKYYGLRFGAVNGPAPNLRVDVMLNKMVHFARQRGHIEFCNPSIYRPVLGLNDLCLAVRAVIEGDAAPGVYNLASFNATVREMAEQTAKTVGVPALAIPDTAGVYNVRVSTNKFENAFDFRFQDTLPTILTELMNQYENCVPTIRD
ncbi:MAG TPA: NAD(P)-dependent oxidoreductase [Pirellulales bacterium]